MEVFGETTKTSWTNEFKGEELYVCDWYERNGWDFIGSVVDIQLKNDDGYFFIKYVGTIENEQRELIHFGIEKFSGRKILFVFSNIFAIRDHHSARLERDRDTAMSIFEMNNEKVEEETMNCCK